MKKSVSEKSAKRSKNASQKKKNDKTRTKSEDPGRTQRDKEHLSIKSVKKRILIPEVKNKKGETINTRQGIAYVFAEFYENLYEGEEGDEDKRTGSSTEEDERIPEFTKNEIQDAIDRLKKGKAKDSSG